VLQLDWIPHGDVREIVARRFELQNKGEWTGAAAFLTQLENAQARTLVSQALAEDRPLNEPEKILKGYLGKQGVVEFLRDKSIERRAAILNQEMAHPNLTEAQQRELLEKKSNLMAEKKQPIGRVS
ncbi:MAG: hypothetical protein ABI042_19250, partial [Verrucomicrobiota bacterium]